MKAKRKQKNQNDTVVGIAASWMDFGEKRPAFDFAEDFILFFTILPVLFVLPVLLKESARAYWAAAVLPADFAALTAVRLRTKYWWLFGLLVTGVTAAFTACFVLLRAWLAIAAAVIAAFVCVHKLRSTVVRRKKEREEFSSNEDDKGYLGAGVVRCSFFLCLAVYFFAFAKQVPWLKVCCVCSFVAVCAAMLIYTHFFGESRFSQWEKATGDPERHPPKMHGGTFAFLVTACCCATAAVVWLAVRLTGASRADSALLSFLRSRQNNRIPHPQASNDVPVGMKPPAGELAKLAKSSPPSPFWTALGMILKIALTVMTAAVVIFLVVVGIRALFRCLSHAGSIPEERQSIFPGQRAVKAAGKKLRRAAMDFGLLARGSNRIKIRRMFLAFVRRHRSAGVAGSDAPTEIVQKIGGDSLGEAASLYERARYGKDECEAADVSRMRKSLRPTNNPAKNG